MRKSEHIDDNIQRCRVCGLKQEFLPWGDDGQSPTFEFCDCCGVEFGYEDFTLAGVRSYREKWLTDGAKWFHPQFKLADWDLEEQLKHIPPEYR